MNSLIFLAAGEGRRVGAGKNKMLLSVNGKPLVWYSLKHVLQSRALDEIILVTQEKERPEFETVVRSFHAHIPIIFATGGKTRSESVKNGLHAVSEASDKVLVHDGARPLVDGPFIDSVLAAVSEKAPAVVTGIPCVDTIKKVTAEGMVTGTLDRKELFRAQTPQGFCTPLFRQVVDSLSGDETFTDDVSIFEYKGIPVKIIQGRESFFKVTTREDVERFMTSLEQPKIAFRIGQGYDIHQFCDDRPLILGGIKISDTHGLLGHSDADALIHAIMDSLLGAAGLPDIGHFFPDDDPEFENASSVKLLVRVMRKIRDMGYEVGNVDTTIIAQKPKLAGYIPEMKACLAQVMGITEDALGIKATTKEKMDAIGEGRAIAVMASSLLYRRI